jgi:hypothetical protein
MYSQSLDENYIKELIKSKYSIARKNLADKLREEGLNPTEYESLIKASFKIAEYEIFNVIKDKIADISRTKDIHPAFMDALDIALREMVKDHSSNALRFILSERGKIMEAGEKIRTFGSVFLVGAGLSKESELPSTENLEEVLRYVGAKNYDELRQDPDKCLKFKTHFKDLCDRKKPGKSHKLIVRNFGRYILEIICLNWDNLLERAAEDLKIIINKVNREGYVQGMRYLWKFHGDVDYITQDNIKGNGGWVFPDEGGFVFNCFKDYIERTRLINKLFVFVIVGYSEKEQNIYKDIINLFSKEPPRPTFRIGLDPQRRNEDNYILGPADYVLEIMFPD